MSDRARNAILTGTAHLSESVLDALAREGLEPLVAAVDRAIATAGEREQERARLIGYVSPTMLPLPPGLAFCACGCGIPGWGEEGGRWIGHGRRGGGGTLLPIRKAPADVIEGAVGWLAEERERLRRDMDAAHPRAEGDQRGDTTANESKGE